MSDNGSLVRVFSGSLIDVELVKSQMEAIGVSSMIKNEFQSGLNAGFGVQTNSVDLLIYENDLEKAEEVLKQL